MAAEVDYKDALTSDQIRAMLGSGKKTILVRDGAGRIEESYEAPIHAKINDPCLRTKYKYLDGAGGTSRKTIAYEEEVVAWPGYELLDAGAGNDIDNLA